MPLSTFPTHLTLSPEERAKLGLPEPGTAGTARSSRLIKEHTFGVTYPDGTEGKCSYTRYGPAFHRFEFSYGDAPAHTMLPHQYHSSALGNTLKDIEAQGQTLAEGAFYQAVKKEQDEHFKRALPPYGTKVSAASCQFSVKRAKEIGGKYALCARLGAKLVPVGGGLFDTLEAANEAWLDQPQPDGVPYVIGCACRWSRHWEVPRFNRLYKHFPHLKAQEPG